MRRGQRTFAILFLLLAALVTGCGRQSPPAADAVYRNGYVYTVDAARSIARAVAVKDGAIVFVGDDEGAAAHIGSATMVVDLEGRMLMPGLHDAHIHPMGIVAMDRCDLDNTPVSLDELVVRLRGCMARYQYQEAAPIVVYQWNPFSGNEPNARYSTIMAALDAVSTRHPIYLMGSDGHHGAANSVAFKLARNEAGETVGINKDSIAGEFSRYSLNIGTDAEGNPNGLIDETARELIDFPSILDVDPAVFEPILPLIAQKLNRYGITSVQDAAASEGSIDLYKTMADNGDMTVRVTAAMHFALDEFYGISGFDYDGAVARYRSVRDSLGDYPYLKADAVKIFADGVLEGNPYNDPPVLPNAAVLSRFHQPRFDLSRINDDNPAIELIGYVDLDSTLCQRVRGAPQDYDERAEIDAFKVAHGYYPVQCKISSGQTETDPAFMNTMVPKLDAADFVVHMHAIGDRAVRLSLDAIEAARRGSQRKLPHSISHLQLIAPVDQQRMGELGVYAAYTYSWILPDYFYEMTIIPFIDRIKSAAVEHLFSPDGYYMQNVYPVKATMDAGAILVAGSDAPVDTREPQPFVNITQGITRANEEGVVLNAANAVSVQDMIAAYTINGARAMRQQHLVGSLEVGKRADMIVLDRNIVELAEQGRAAEIQDTKVDITIFDGDEVYRRSN